MFLVVVERTSAARFWLVLGILLSTPVGIGCVDNILVPADPDKDADTGADSTGPAADSAETAGACSDVEPLPEASSVAAPTCTLVGDVLWDPRLAWEWQGTGSDSYLTSPIAIPSGGQADILVGNPTAGTIIVATEGDVSEVRTDVDQFGVTLLSGAFLPATATVAVATAVPGEESPAAYSPFMLDLVTGSTVIGPGRSTLTNEEVLIADVNSDGAYDLASPAGLMAADGNWLSTYAVEGYSNSSLLVDQIDPSTPELEVVTKGGVWADDNTSRQYWGEELFWIGGVTSRNGRPFAVYVTWPDLEGRWLDDGSLAWHVGGVDYGYRLALGDTDGDGSDEVCASVGGELRLMDLGGSTLQTWPTDPGRMSGSCTFTDLDGDGKFEVLDWNASGLYARLPSTGETLFAIDDFGTGSFQLMSPAVADVDGDGSTDIVLTGVDLASGASWPNSIRVYSSSTASWAPTTSVWSSPSFAAGTASPDGRPQSRPLVPGWQRRMGFRAQPSLVGIPDLLPIVDDVCVDCAAGEVSVALRVENRGAVGASGVVLHVSRWTESGWLDDATLEFGGVSAGTLSPGQVVNLPLPGDSEYTVWVSGNERDCNPDDDVVDLSLDACP